MKKDRRWRLVASAAAVGAFAVGMLIPASAASAFTHTNCSWSTGGTGNVTWQNNIGSVHSDTAIAAASSWASYTDVNDMSPSGGTMVATAPNDGPNGYHGWTSLGTVEPATEPGAPA